MKKLFLLLLVGVIGLFSFVKLVEAKEYKFYDNYAKALVVLPRNMKTTLLSDEDGAYYVHYENNTVIYTVRRLLLDDDVISDISNMGISMKCLGSSGMVNNEYCKIKGKMEGNGYCFYRIYGYLGNYLYMISIVTNSTEYDETLYDELDFIFKNSIFNYELSTTDEKDDIIIDKNDKDNKENSNSTNKVITKTISINTTSKEEYLNNMIIKIIFTAIVLIYSIKIIIDGVLFNWWTFFGVLSLIEQVIKTLFSSNLLIRNGSLDGLEVITFFIPGIFAIIFLSKARNIKITKTNDDIEIL